MAKLQGQSHSDVFVLTGIEADFLLLLLGPHVEEQALLSLALEVEMAR